MINRIVAGDLFAVIADDTILVPEASKDATCALHILDAELEPYDLALGFRRTFDRPDFVAAVNTQLLYLLQSGVLEVCSHTAIRPQYLGVEHCRHFKCSRKSRSRRRKISML